MPYQLTPDEKRQVALFTKRVEELEKTPLYTKKGGPDLGVGLSMSYKRGEHFRIAAHGPDENDLRAALTIIRQFQMDREPIFVNRICNLCMRGIKSSETDPVRGEWANNLKRLLEEQRGIWRAAHQRCGGFRLVIDGKDVRPEEAWDLWINGQYFHGDAEKVAKLEEFGEVEEALRRHSFLNFVQDTIIYAVNLRTILKIAFNEGHLVN